MFKKFFWAQKNLEGHKNNFGGHPRKTPVATGLGGNTCNHITVFSL